MYVGAKKMGIDLHLENTCQRALILLSQQLSGLHWSSQHSLKSGYF